MILIVSTILDIPTQRVVQWLRKFNKSFLVLNEQNRISELDIHLSPDLGNNLTNEVQLKFTVNNVTYDYREFTRVWLRKTVLYFEDIDNLQSKSNSRLLTNEIETLSEFILDLFKTRKGIGFKYLNEINKLTVLKEAQSCGFRIPETTILMVNDSFEKKIDAQGNWINKTIGAGAMHYNKAHLITNRTIRVKSSMLRTVSSSFPTLFQREVSKKFEIRIFFFLDSYWAMAIFSQHDRETEVDFRNYNLNNLSRMVPYRLPFTLKNQLRKLVKRLELETGSFDLIIDNEGNVFFLEVNPTGQFSFLSDMCNFQIEKEIATIL